MISKICIVCGTGFSVMNHLHHQQSCSDACSRKRRRGAKYNHKPPLERLLSKIDVMGPDDCWPFMGHCNEDGYGTFSLGDDMVGAHRAIWILTNGLIPDDRHVLHRCDNPPCCNLRHLFLGDNETNVADKMAKGRHVTRRGEDNPCAKITFEVAQNIRSNQLSNAKAAKVFGISATRIGQIRRNECWTLTNHQGDHHV